MLQDSSSNYLYEAHWDRRGKIRTLFPADKAEAQSDEKQEIFRMQEHLLGGFVGTIQAESSIAAYRIAQEHMICILMNIHKCKHMKSGNSKSNDQNDAI